MKFPESISFRKEYEDLLARPFRLNNANVSTYGDRKIYVDPGNPTRTFVGDPIDTVIMRRKSDMIRSVKDCLLSHNENLKKAFAGNKPPVVILGLATADITITTVQILCIVVLFLSTNLKEWFSNKLSPPRAQVLSTDNECKQTTIIPRCAAPRRHKHRRGCSRHGNYNTQLS